MSMLEQTAAQYRSLRMTAIAGELAQLLAEAEASEMSYLSFAHRLSGYELQQRQGNRVQRNHKAAGFPAHKYLRGLTTVTRPRSISGRSIVCWTSSLSMSATT